MGTRMKRRREHKQTEGINRGEDEITECGDMQGKLSQEKDDSIGVILRGERKSCLF